MDTKRGRERAEVPTDVNADASDASGCFGLHRYRSEVSAPIRSIRVSNFVEINLLPNLRRLERARLLITNHQPVTSARLDEYRCCDSPRIGDQHHSAGGQQAAK